MAVGRIHNNFGADLLPLDEDLLPSGPVSREWAGELPTPGPMQDDSILRELPFDQLPGAGPDIGSQETPRMRTTAAQTPVGMAPIGRGGSQAAPSTPKAPTPVAGQPPNPTVQASGGMTPAAAPGASTSSVSRRPAIFGSRANGIFAGDEGLTGGGIGIAGGNGGRAQSILETLVRMLMI
jgi:hypothetical protein